MKMMKIGDEAFFYHSNIGKEIVGIMKVVKLWHPDPMDDTSTFGMVDVAPVKALTTPVTLAAIKADKSLKDMQLLKQGRLSVASVTDDEWVHIFKKNQLK
jgi:predicted RNA-binding protein with PUA-like domain